MGVGKAIWFEEFPPCRWQDILLYPVSRKSRRNLRINGTPPEKRIVYKLLVSAAGVPAILLKNPKCGCSTLTQAVYFAREGRFFDGDIHLENDVLRQYFKGFAINRDILSNRRIPSFTFTRHPETRAVSAFQNIFLDKKNAQSPVNLRAIASHGFREDLPVETKFDIFLDYVETSISRDALLTDSHWRRQVDNIGHAFCEHDFVGRIESFREDFARVAELLALDAKKRTAFSERYFNKSSEPGFRLTPAQKRRIREIYQPDFEAFSYD